MRISDWSSDVCSSDLAYHEGQGADIGAAQRHVRGHRVDDEEVHADRRRDQADLDGDKDQHAEPQRQFLRWQAEVEHRDHREEDRDGERSEEHTSELQSLMRIPYAVFCMTKKNTQIKKHTE